MKQYLMSVYHPEHQEMSQADMDASGADVDALNAEIKKEHIGGFWVIKVADLDEALKWGAKATQACRVPIEVRPFDGVVEA